MILELGLNVTILLKQATTFANYLLWGILGVRLVSLFVINRRLPR